MRYKPQFEVLENRVLLSSIPLNPVELSIGELESFTFRDADGDQIHVQISGSAGRVTLLEDLSAGVGNGDGKLDDGEVLGGIVIRDASPDFVLHIQANTDGNGIVQLGQVSAISQVIGGIVTEGPAVFHMTSFTGDGFAPGGGLSVDVLHGRLALAELAAGTTVDIRSDFSGEIIIKDDLAGSLFVGGQWTGKLLVGEDFTGTITAAHDVAGEVQIIGNFDGTANIGGSAVQRWLIVGSLHGQMEAAGNIERLEIVRNLGGAVTAGGRVWIDVGGMIQPAATVHGREVFAYVGGNFWGAIDGTDQVYLRVSGIIAATALAESAGPMTVAYGVNILEGSQLLSPELTLHYLPDFATGTVISSVPYVITSPGVYRLADHLIYGGSSGVAIDIRASNVILDMQGFALVNNAGPTTFAIGIQGWELDNVVIRNGTIRGFHTAINLDGVFASRYHVEKIRAEGNWFWGIRVSGAHSILRNNVVLDMGGLAVPDWEIIVAMKAAGPNSLVENNIVSGVVRSSDNKEWVGLHVDQAQHSQVRNNIFAADMPEAITWGIWLNGRPWADGSRTIALLEDNIFVNLETAATWVDHATGAYTANILLDIPEGINHGTLSVPRPVDNDNFQWELVFALDVERQLSQLRRDFGFHYYGDLYPLYFDNWAGLNEKWFLDRSGQWYALLPDGRLYKWDGSDGSLATSLLIEWLDPVVYRSPDLLFAAPVNLTEEAAEQLGELRRAFGFRHAGSFYQGIYGHNEKWFVDRQGQWFALTPDGSLYRWNSLIDDLGSFIDTLDPLVYDDPGLLFAVPVELTTESLGKLAQMRAGHGFRHAGNFYQNLFGHHEKWFVDRLGQWYALTPDGALYHWNGLLGQLGDHIEQIDPLVWDDPALLFSADLQLTEALLDKLEELHDYGFHFSGSFWENVFGHQEKWFLDQHGQWFALTPDGSLYQWNGLEDQLGNIIEELSPIIYDMPTLLFGQVVIQSGPETLSQLRAEYGFHFHHSYHENWAGQGEKWFMDRAGHWHIIFPDGRLIRWNGSSLAEGELLTILSPAVHTDPTLLLGAPLELPQEVLDQIARLQSVYGLVWQTSEVLPETPATLIWLQDRYGGWYALFADGRLYQYDGTSLTTSLLIEQLDAMVFDNREVFLPLA